MMINNNTQWQQELRQAIRQPHMLAQQLDLAWSELQQILPTQNPEQFDLLVPLPFVKRMRIRDLNDPLLRQILPQKQEQQIQAGFSRNPVGDQEKTVTPILLHKYAKRVLLLLHPACAVHCRYCFRQHYPYQALKSTLIQQSLVYIQQQQTINEVIFSGGEPLLLSDNKLAQWIQGIADIPHIKRLRIHSRLPVVIPSRITDEFIHLLTASRLQIILVLHFNHVNEINQEVSQALNKLHQAGLCLLNQTVLLKGVNDHADDLIQLSESLFDNHVLPYYLHALDPVQGAAHFAVSDQKTRKIIHQMQENLAGYLMPKWVREIAGLGFKQPLF